MPEHFRTLVVLMLLATAVFAFAKAPASAPADLSSALEGSGLVMIETRAEAVKAFQPEAPSEPVQPVRRRRNRAPVVADEPLVQVETGPK